MRHGFTDYMRDYDVIVGARNGPPYTDLHKYQFIGCVEACYETKLGKDFERSISDDFVYSGPDYPDKPDPYGFIWGVRFAETWVGGLTYLDNGERAKHWSKIMGRNMHEVTIETNAYFLRLVFADIRYAFLGYEPEVHNQRNYKRRRGSLAAKRLIHCQAANYTKGDNPMLTKIQKSGNSLAIRIPKTFVRDAQLENGSFVEMTVSQGKICSKPTLSIKNQE